ncbi:MAG: hypothetical protein ACOZQL_42560 [Myxococcota bacterium]
MTVTTTDPRAPLLPLDGPPTMDKPAFLRLLQEQRFEEALAVLVKLRPHAPDNASISRGIQHLKDRVLEDYLARLGNLDRAPRRATHARRLTAEEASVARLVDGTSTLGDLLESSTLGRLPTARLLARLLHDGVLTLAGAESHPHLRLVATPPAPAPDFDALLEEGAELLLARRLREALAVFERCEQLRPEHPRVRHNLERLRDLIQR